MQLTKTIRSELLNYIDQHEIILYRFSELSGINSGTLSRIINGSQPISVKILDKITATMGLKEGHFYEQYIDELRNHTNLDWRRVRPLIIRSAELCKLNCIERIVDMMMENTAYIALLFDLADVLHTEGKTEAALILYRKVSEGERFQHAERLAICQYRIFKSTQNDDQQNNLECAVQFEPYAARLNEWDQLDALKDLTNLYLSLRRWDKAKHLAKHMGELATIQYEIKHERIKHNKRFTEPSKPLFGYILYSNLILGSISEEQNEYQQALHYLSYYEDHSWIVENEYADEQTKKQFRIWAEGNKYLYRLMAGEVEVLDDYIEYLASREHEILKGLFKVIKAAKKYHINVDHILARFEDTIDAQIKNQENVGSYTDQIINDRFVNFLADVGEYYVSSDRVDTGIQFILNSLAISAKINSNACILRCFCMFDALRHLVTEVDLRRYKEILKEVHRQL
ncbi:MULTISPECIES: transcriptional regulator [Paenibacillus]|uniref:transcriptional regulator n=1 Tax=Paenibacillus TaxID=44249 RepID=UPI0009A6DD52|nr:MULTISPECIES: transcriptional regulator [Paenibacillus]MCZ1267697.1 XRE family transcriptional regulator [Paenibacillus tundrae]SLK16131.1 hypothetical protein SAMN06272722_11080 [Paenibacillus sp. RU5A]SOC74216.1 hypothetical protein SAMN05880581_11080 [Paenibacillus sp. RU26A]SOC76365.1 hypothetical protein SAMN05880586_11080 [Paenibacillus sp. RU5M]